MFGIEYKKALIQGAVAYAYATYSGNTGSFPSTRFNVMYPAPMVIGAAALGSGIVGDTIHDTILPRMNKGGKFMKTDSALLSSMIHGATFIGLLSFYNPSALQTFGTTNLLVEGIGSDMVADYVSNMIGY